MTQRTKAALATQVSTLLADNTTGAISESDVRSVFTDTADSLVGGPTSATDNAVVRYDSTTGQLVQNSAVIIDDSNNVSGFGDITITTAKAIQTDTTTAHTALFKAYDVDGTAYKTFATLTNGNTPSFDITAPAGGTVTINATSIGASTAGSGAFTTLTASGNVDINTNKFNITAASGNTAIAGTLVTTGAVTNTSTTLCSDDVTIANGKAIKPDTTTAHTMKLQAYDVDGTAYKDFITFTNANTPTMVISSPAGGTATIEGTAIGGVTTAAGAFTTLSASGNITASAYILRSVGNALTAAGTTRADALQLAKEVNNVTTAASGTGVILPTGVVGMRIDVFNAGANTIKVYANGSETIDGTSGSTGVSLTNAKRCSYWFTAANTWISAQLGVVSA